MTITAKFATVCPCCNGRINAGDKVEWSKGSKARHVSCTAGATAPVASAPRRSYPRRSRAWDAQCSCAYCRSGNESMCARDGFGR